MSIVTVENTVFQAADGSEIKYETAAEHGSLDQDDFMKLFITELQYQDPMQPLESADMASQVAQFNMVDLMYKNNDALEDMVASQNSRTSMDAVSMIGHQVRYEGNVLPVTEDGPMAFSVELNEPASMVEVVIKDEQGNAVASWDMGFLTSGKNDLGWDGTDMEGNPVPPGDYTVMVHAVDEQGLDLEVTTWTTGIVSGVEYSEDGAPTLVMADGSNMGLQDIWMVEE
jgi:flagellar basal-body rod modification protein FlgD